jgi:riboflavin synthase
MFTGLVETVGTVRGVSGRAPLSLTIASAIPAHEVAIGDSVAIDGCCLTMVERAGEALTFEAATETLARTTVGELRVGDRVNLERALRLGDRLGGHLVLGHVDGVGVIERREQKQSALYLRVSAPWEVMRLTAARGSVCVAGISLTVTEVDQRGFGVAVIPHTLDATTLCQVKVGQRVNLEADLLARYLERLLETRTAPQDAASGLTLDFLKERGFA